jgi:hypothetical protein
MRTCIAIKVPSIDADSKLRFLLIREMGEKPNFPPTVRPLDALLIHGIPPFRAH